MATAELGIPLGSFWGENHAWISAVISLLVAVAIATALDRAFRARIVAERLHDELPLSREADTRLRFVRRLIYATILLIGVAVALSQFTGVNRLAGSLLASSAIAAAVLGFAARQTLANLVAGVMLAVTQPLRIGDWVTIEGNTGAVEDVRLNYTVLRTAGDQRIMIPNERLAGGILRNDTLTVDRVVLDVSVWIQPDADTDRAIQELEDETGQTVTVAEAVPWGVRLAVGADPVPPADKGTAEAELRARCLRRLRGAGLLPAGGTAGRL